jgi:hypothetical protein
MQDCERTDLEQLLEGYSARIALNVSGSEVRNWGAFTCAAMATTVLAATAEASVIYSGPQNIQVPSPSFTSEGSSVSGQLFLDLDQNGIVDVRLDLRNIYYETYAGLLAGQGGAQVARRPVLTGGRRELINFGVGSTIGASQSFTDREAHFLFDRGATTLESWEQNETGIAGVRFDGHFAWIRINVGHRTAAEVVDWAYESEPGASLRAGDVPEPSAASLTGLALLAMGAVGVSRHRKKARGQRRSRSQSRGARPPGSPSG